MCHEQTTNTTTTEVRKSDKLCLKLNRQYDQIASLNIDTVDANVELGFKVDLRHFGLGAQILADLGVVKFNLLTNNPKKVVGLESFGLKLEKVVPIIADVNKENKKYLSAKSSRLGHKLDTLFN